MPPASATGPTILIIDDDDLLTTTLSTLFTQAGYTVDKARDGVEGLDKALSTHPKILIVDYQLPGMNGVNLIQKIREDTWGASVPIIFATNSYDIDIMNNVMRLGVTDYILKNDTSLDNIKDLVTKYVLFK